MTDLTLTDLLPPNLAYLAVTSVTPASGVVDHRAAIRRAVAAARQRAVGRVRLGDRHRLARGRRGRVHGVRPRRRRQRRPGASTPPPVHRPRCWTTDRRRARSCRSTPAIPTCRSRSIPGDVTVDDHVLTARSLAVQKTADPAVAVGQPRARRAGRVHAARPGVGLLLVRPRGDRRRARRRPRDRPDDGDLHGQRARRGDDRQLHGRRRPHDRRDASTRAATARPGSASTCPSA